jgi:hypothetical protein
MADQSGSTRFRARFESALQAYQETTGVTLAEHPLTAQLRNLRSVESESISTILQCEARESSDLLGSDRTMRSIESTVSTLFTLSAAASFGDAIDLVRKHGLMACFHIPHWVFFTAMSTCESNNYCPRYSVCRMCHSVVTI